MDDGQTVDATRFSDTLRQWHRRKCGVLFCLSIAIFLFGPVKDALSFSSPASLVTSESPASAPTIAGKSDGDESPIRATQLLGSQRDEPVPARVSEETGDAPTLVSAAPEVPRRAGKARPGWGNKEAGPSSSIGGARPRAPPAS